MPAEIRKSMELRVGCVAGALSDEEYRQKLAKAGFEAIQIEETRVFNVEDAREFLSVAGVDADAIASQIQNKFISAFVRARKPQNSEGRCHSNCCSS